MEYRFQLLEHGVFKVYEFVDAESMSDKKRRIKQLREQGMMPVDIAAELRVSYPFVLKELK